MHRPVGFCMVWWSTLFQKGKAFLHGPNTSFHPSHPSFLKQVRGPLALDLYSGGGIDSVYLASISLWPNVGTTWPTLHLKT